MSTLSLFADQPRVLFRLTVVGHPEPAGSKKALPTGGKKGGRPIVVDANPKAKPWKNTIARQAQLAMAGSLPIDYEVHARFVFYVTRPQSHFGARGLLSTAPVYPGVRPDVLKLARAVEDALSEIVYTDDALIVDEVLRKRYCDQGEPERVEIEITDVVH